ncbi:MAG: ATPase [Prevotella sp.]|nr:ATPase [Prevotella sp.]
MNSNTLLADSGSTKTDWALGSLRMKTQGINPIHQDDDAILRILQDELCPQLTSGPRQLYGFDSIRFYGSGVRPEQEARMERLLKTAFPQAEHVEVKSDLLGAARALCGNAEGLACILGTGANSCLYDGEKIVANTPPMGYILGDEGSGAVLGARFLNALYKGRLYAGAQEDFEQHLGLSMADVITRVYRQPMANRWLASLSEFISTRLEHPEVRAIVVQNFRDFISRNIRPYGRPDLALNAVGSIAYYYREQLAEAADAEGYRLGRVLRSPIDGLATASFTN